MKNHYNQRKAKDDENKFYIITIILFFNMLLFLSTIKTQFFLYKYSLLLTSLIVNNYVSMIFYTSFLVCISILIMAIKNKQLQKVIIYVCEVLILKIAQTQRTTTYTLSQTQKTVTIVMMINLNKIIIQTQKLPKLMQEVSTYILIPIMYGLIFCVLQIQRMVITIIKTSEYIQKIFIEHSIKISIFLFAPIKDIFSINGETLKLLLGELKREISGVKTNEYVS